MKSFKSILLTILVAVVSVVAAPAANASLSVSIQSPTADGFNGSIGMPYEAAGSGTADVYFSNFAGTNYFFKREFCGGAVTTYFQLPETGAAWINGLYVSMLSQQMWGRTYRFASIPTGSAQPFCFVSDDGYQSSYLTSTVSTPQPTISNLRIVADGAVAGGQKLCVDYSPQNPAISSFNWIENNIIKATGSPAELWSTYVCWNRTSALVAGQTYNVQLRYNGSSSLNSNTLSITMPPPAPAMPTNVTATQNSPTYLGQVMVSWSAAANATSYEVFRYNADWTNPTFAGWAGGSSMVNQTWFLDTPPAAGVPYNYQVIGYSNVTYLVGPAGTASTTGIAAPLALTTPVQGLVASNIYLDRIQLSWSPLNGATSYEIQRTLSDPARTVDGAAISVSPGTISTYPDTVPVSGATRCYKIRGVNVSGSGPWSAEACGTRTLLVVPPLTVSQGTVTGLTRLTWSAPSTYTASQSQIWRLRSTTNLADWELLATLPGSTLTWDDSSTRGADTIADFYRLHQSDANGNVGGWTMTSTSSYTSNIGSGYANAAPTSVSATIATTANQSSAPATLAVVDPNVTAGQTEAFSYALITQPPAGQGTCTVVANKVTWSPDPSFGFAGVTTCTVRATDKGNATVQGQVTITINPVVPGVPTGVNATDGTATGAINVTWVSAANAVSYIVYRDGTQIGTSSTTAAVDPNPVGATIYSYRVAAVSSSGATSAQSLADTGYANVAPTTVTSTINATANSGGSAPLVVSDANATAGQTEAYSFAVTSDPGSGRGSCSIAGNTASWTPPNDNSFVGDLSCSVVVTDRGGAATTGTITVHVTPTIPGVPTNVAATDGTVTGSVAITWSSALNAASYRILRNGVEIGTTVTTAATDSTAVLSTAYTYKVVAVSVTGGQSADSTPDTGYANLPPTAVSATIANAISNAASSYATPVVVDPNVTAGQSESFVLAVVTQPGAGQGTCEVNASGVRWVPPVALDFSGVTSCAISARDRGGESVTGQVTITVTAYVPPAPTAVSATDGTINGKVGITWGQVPGALSYRVVRAPTSTGPTWTEVASSVTSNALIDVSDATPAYYAVRTVASSGVPSVNSQSDSGFPNLAPTSAVVAITTAADVPSVPKAPTISDPNGAQAMSVMLLTQPPNGMGTVTLSGSGTGLFTYTPPPAATFTGITTFTFSATDPGGLSVVGVGTVTVTAATPETPTGVIATKGTVTGGVKVDWNAANKAASYDVYRAGVKVNDGPIVGTSFTYPTTSVLAAAYAVRAVSASGGLSAISGPDSGYANLAPTSTSFTGAAVANAVNVNIGTITTIDPNKAAGQVEVFQYTASPIPTSLGGTVSIGPNGSVMYTAPATTPLEGPDTFNFTVSDKAGASASGLGQVDVCFAPALDAVTASATDLSGNVRARACNGALTITHSFRVRAPGDAYTTVATPLNSSVPAVASATPESRTFTTTLTGAVSEPGQYEVTSQLVDAIGQASAPRISFYEIACSATPNAISLGTISVDYLASGGAANSSAGPLRACQQNASLDLIAARADAPSVVVATASSNAASPLSPAGGNVVWAMPAMNAGNYVARLRLSWTFGNAPGTSFVEKPFSVTCPDPVVGKAGRSIANPDQASINFWLPMCADGSPPVVTLTLNGSITPDGSITRSGPPAAVGSGSMYVFTSAVPAVTSAQYSLQIVDAASRTTTATGTLTTATTTTAPSLSGPSGNTTDSLGKLRVLPAAGGPQRPAN